MEEMGTSRVNSIWIIRDEVNEKEAECTRYYNYRLLGTVFGAWASWYDEESRAQSKAHDLAIEYRKSVVYQQSFVTMNSAAKTTRRLAHSYKVAESYQYLQNIWYGLSMFMTHTSIQLKRRQRNGVFPRQKVRKLQKRNMIKYWFYRLDDRVFRKKTASALLFKQYEDRIRLGFSAFTLRVSECLITSTKMELARKHARHGITRRVFMALNVRVVKAKTLLERQALGCVGDVRIKYARALHALERKVRRLHEGKLHMSRAERCCAKLCTRRAVRRWRNWAVGRLVTGTYAVSTGTRIREESKRAESATPELTSNLLMVIAGEGHGNSNSSKSNDNNNNNNNSCSDASSIHKMRAVLMKCTLLTNKYLDSVHTTSRLRHGMRMYLRWLIRVIYQRQRTLNIGIQHCRHVWTFRRKSHGLVLWQCIHVKKAIEKRRFRLSIFWRRKRLLASNWSILRMNLQRSRSISWARIKGDFVYSVKSCRSALSVFATFASRAVQARRNIIKAVTLWACIRQVRCLHNLRVNAARKREHRKVLRVAESEYSASLKREACVPFINNNNNNNKRGGIPKMFDKAFPPQCARTTAGASGSGATTGGGKDKDKDKDKASPTAPSLSSSPQLNSVYSPQSVVLQSSPLHEHCSTDIAYNYNSGSVSGGNKSSKHNNGTLTGILARTAPKIFPAFPSFPSTSTVPSTAPASHSSTHHNNSNSNSNNRLVKPRPMIENVFRIVDGQLMKQTAVTDELPVAHSEEKRDDSNYYNNDNNEDASYTTTMNSSSGSTGTGFMLVPAVKQHLNRVKVDPNEHVYDTAASAGGTLAAQVLIEEELLKQELQAFASELAAATRGQGGIGIGIGIDGEENNNDDNNNSYQ